MSVGASASAPGCRFAFMGAHTEEQAMSFELKAPSAPKLDIPPNYEYEFHPFANLFPMIKGDELEQLKRDIAKNGIHQPIVLFAGKILDGRNRYTAGKAVGHKFTPENFKAFTGNEVQAKAFVISTNIHRRHLSNQDKQDFVRKLIEENPMASARQIARMAGVNHKTVAAVREKMKPVEQVKFEDFKKAWNNLTDEQQTEFVEEFKIDIQEMLA